MVSPAAAEEYFKGISWIGAVIIRPSARNQNVENGRNDKNPDRSDPTTSFDGNDAEEIGGKGDKEDLITVEKESLTSEEKNEEMVEKEKQKEKEKKAEPSPRAMNAKAVQFRLISGSIFLSLCLTAVLSNAIRILGKKREEKNRRMAKAKEAYEVPTQAVLNRKPSEKFVGMLDDGAIPTR